jgi:hypothetical protein
LLTNGTLDAIEVNGDPNIWYPDFAGWTMVTDPCSNFPCAIVPYVFGQPYTPYSGHPAQYADRLTNGNVAGKNGFVTETYQGAYPFEVVGPVDAQIIQTVPGTAGSSYQLLAWAHMEGGYSGGHPTITNPTGFTNVYDGLATPTRTYLALEFLDSSSNVIPGSIVKELRLDLGQVADNDQTGTNRDWIQHALIGQAPFGTVSVRVRASVVDGVFNFDVPGGSQNVFFDDLSLRAIPEPSTWALGMIGLALAAFLRRR